MSNPAYSPTNSETRPPPDLATKLYPPRLRPYHVSRPRLDSWFGGNPAARVAVVCAPAGSGKSTLAAQWLARAGIPAAWVTLEAGDGRPQALFRLIVTALRSVDTDLVPVTAALAADPRAFDTDTAVHQLIAELSATTRPIALVLDDYHTVDAPETHRAVDQLLQNLPAPMRFVLIGRTIPPFQLDLLAETGEFVLLGPRELAFTRSEATAFYRQALGLRLRSKEVDGILARTNGSAAGLHLAGVSLRGRTSDRTRSVSADVAGDSDLWEVLLASQPADVQTFLLRTSVLDRFTAELCNAITGNDDGVAMIHRWEREGLFLVPLDDRGVWYRYHHLFADVLRARLAQSMTEYEIADLHHRASTWLESQGLVSDAVRHSIAARDWDRAVALLELFCAGLFDRDHIATLRGRLEGLPEEIFLRSPRLAFWLAWALGRSGYWQEGASLLEAAQSTWSKAGCPSEKGLIELWHACRATYAFENDAALDMAERSLEHLPEEQATARVMALMIRGMGRLYGGEPVPAVNAFADVRRTIDGSGQTWFRSFEMTYSAMASAQQGNLATAAGLSVAALKEMGDSPVEIWAQPALRQLGDIFLEWGRLEDARHSYMKALRLAERSGTLHWQSRIRFGLARTLWALGEQEAAFTELDRAIDTADVLGVDQDTLNARAWRARFWLKSGQLLRARGWADSSALLQEQSPRYAQQVEYLTLARLLIREGRPDGALLILQRLDDLATGAGRTGDQVEIAVVTALAHVASGADADAHRSLERALELGQPGGYRQVFVNERTVLRPLLANAVERGGHRDYAMRLLADIETSEART